MPFPVLPAQQSKDLVLLSRNQQLMNFLLSSPHGALHPYKEFGFGWGFFGLVVGFLSGWGFFGGCFGEEEKGNASLALIGAATEGLERFHSLHGDFPWTLDTWGRRTGHVRGKTRARRSRNVQSQRSGRASLQQGLLEAAP